jgi:diguanylate cyclase (GGDEF)-like protein/PAS domain S-box-containing protein
MLKKLSVKNKTMFFVTVLLVIFAVVLFMTIYINQKNKLMMIQEEHYLSLKKSYEKIVNKHRSFYENRIMANINSKGVKEVFSAKNREKLYDISKGRWDTLSKENKYLKVMHFHNPDGTSFLRMHKPEKFGDNIAHFRPMVEKMHQIKKPLYGFEAGIFNLAYRIFLPIFYKNEYIGALEFGSRPDHLLNEMEYFNDIEGALFIKNTELNLYKENNTFKLKDYTLQYSTLKDESLVYKLPTSYNFEQHFHHQIDGKEYAVYSFGLKDFTGKTTAKIVFFQDISDIQQAFINTAKQLVILILGLIALLVFAINIGFNKILTALDAKNTELHKNQFFMNSILENIAHAVIATDKDGIITLFNKKAESMLGYQKEDIVGKKTPELFHQKNQIEQRAREFSEKLGKDIKPGFEVFVAKTDAGLDNDDEWIYVDSNGREFSVDLHVTSMVDINGNVNGYLGIAEDITFEKILQENSDRQKNELETIVSTTKDGIAILDMETNFLFFNDAYLKMTGFTKDELLEQSCAGLTASEDIEKTQSAIGEVLVKGYLENFEKTCIVKDGKRLTVSMSIALMPDKQRLLVSAKDITEAKEKEKQIDEYVKLLDKNIITSSTNIDGDITYVSEAFCKISGYTKDELIGQNHRLIRHPDMKESVFKGMWKTIIEGKTWQGEVKNIAKDGSFYWVQTSISPIFNQDGKKVGYTAIRQDITDKKLIEEISITDGLTGIYNRRHFNELFPKVINSAKRNDDLVSFLIMDIDHFKQYNDTYGHQMGDDVLIKVAGAIKESLHRADDHCFRLGGEEFGVVFKADTKEKAEQFANTIKDNIENLHIEHTGNSASSYVTASMGLICKNANEINDADEVYKQGDDLLYTSKKAGRNRVSI